MASVPTVAGPSNAGAYAGAGGDLLNAAGNFIGGKQARNDANKRYRNAQQQVKGYQDEYRNYQQMLQGSLGQNPNLFGPQTTTTTSSQEQAINQLVSPEMSAEYSPMAGMLRQAYEGRLKRGTALPPGYAERQVANISAVYAPEEQAVRNMAARQGVSADTLMLGSPTSRARAGQIADFQANLPLMERQMQNEDLAGAQGLAAQFGLGQRTKGRTTGTGTSTTTGGPDIRAILAYYNLLAPPAPTVLL